MAIGKIIQSAEDLQAAILQLEQQRAEEGRQLKHQFEAAYASIKPINLIKSTFREVVDSTEIKGHMVNSGIGLAAGYIAKYLFVSKTSSPLRKLLGTLVMFAVTNLVSRNADRIGDVSKSIVAGISEAIDQHVEIESPVESR